MSENTTPDGNLMPPKLNLKKEDPPASFANLAGKDREDKKHTARVDLPETPPEATATLKKKTSRIPLDQVSAEPGAPAGAPVPGIGASKTIRLTSTFATPTITIAPSPKAVPVTMLTDDAKRQTSRIPLDIATTGRDDGAGQGDIPKTIRIKRPTVTPSIAIPVETVAPPSAAEAPAPAKAITSRIDLPETESAEGGQVTQRKTIKIRRAEGGPTVKAAPRSPAVARMEQAAAAHAADDVNAPHPIFPVLAAVAVVLLCVLVYVLCVQAFPSLNWSFPGKVTL